MPNPRPAEEDEPECILIHCEVIPFSRLQNRFKVLAIACLGISGIIGLAARLGLLASMSGTVGVSAFYYLTMTIAFVVTFGPLVIVILQLWATGRVGAIYMLLTGHPGVAFSDYPDGLWLLFAGMISFSVPFTLTGI